MKEAIDDLRKVVNEKTSDKFVEGDVIRWTAAGRYTYAAIKTAVGWYTTASASNPFIENVVDYDDLVEYLGRSEVSDIKVATEWEQL